MDKSLKQILEDATGRKWIVAGARILREKDNPAKSVYVGEIQKKIDEAKDLVKSVARGRFNGMIISDTSGGIGKSRLVKEVFEELKKSGRETLKLGPGTVSAAKTFEYMKSNPDAIILLDDINKIWDDPGYDGILKGALEPEREVTYSVTKGPKTDLKKGERPDTIKFNGGLIINTNVPKEYLYDKGYGPILSRIPFINLTETDRDKMLEHIASILDKLAPELENEISVTDRYNIMMALYKNQDAGFSPRAVENALRLFRDFSDSWEDKLHVLS